MKYMFCIDGSQPAKRAFDKALDLANLNSELLIVTALEYINNDLIPRTVIDHSDERKEVWTKAKAMLKSYKKRAVDKGFPKERVKLLISVGNNPREQLIETAEEQQVDFIVCGPRGISGLERLVVGSTSTYILHHCKCNVLLVK